MLMTREQVPNKDTLEDYVSIGKAVRYSGYAEQYLRRLARTGKIQGHKFGFFWMINLKSLKDYMDQTSNLNQHDKRYGPRELED